MNCHPSFAIEVALLGRPRQLPEDVVLYAADHLAEDVAKVRRLDVQEDLMRIEEQHPRSTQADGGQLLESTSNRFMSRHQFTLPIFRAFNKKPLLNVLCSSFFMLSSVVQRANTCSA